jgi:hypothetical protein
MPGGADGPDWATRGGGPDRAHLPGAQDTGPSHPGNLQKRSASQPGKSTPDVSGRSKPPFGGETRCVPVMLSLKHLLE